MGVGRGGDEDNSGGESKGSGGVSWGDSRGWVEDDWTESRGGHEEDSGRKKVNTDKEMKYFALMEMRVCDTV